MHSMEYASSYRKIIYTGYYIHWENALNKFLSTIKTKCTTASIEPSRWKISYQRPIEQVIRFYYLGDQISNWGYLAITWQQISQICKDIDILKKPHTKEQTYTIRVQNDETSSDSTTTKRRLRTTEMKTLRTITDHNLLDRNVNTDILWQYKTEVVVVRKNDGNTIGSLLHRKINKDLTT